MTKIKWGIIGCGNIAHKFAKDLALIDSAELTAVASRSSQKAMNFATKHHALKSYDSYKKLLLDTSIDIVYIATPHTSHAELSILAMQHKKHVLCEKPLGINAAEVASIIKTSKETNCFFMEALWTRFNPTIIALKKQIDTGEIGNIKYINADFSFLFSGDIKSRAIALELGGGALLDIGIYPVFLSYLLLGIPKEIIAKAAFHKLTGCDMQTAMIFSYTDTQAILYCSFTSNSEMTANISGTKGEIHIHSQWHHSDSFTLIKNNKKEVVTTPKKGIGYTHEIEECHKCILNNKLESTSWSHQNSADLISILDTVRQKTGLQYPTEN